MAKDPFILRDLEAQNELSPTWTNGFTPLTVSILRVFTPFTSAVVLLVELVDAPNPLQIPRTFILKLGDRRFGYRLHNGPQSIWRPAIEDELRAQLPRILGPNRSQRIPEKYYRDPVAPEVDDDAPLVFPVWDGWELEVHVWTMTNEAYLGEALAYRHLHTLQGGCIPRMHGTVRLPLSHGSPFLHPIVDFVSGLAIEHIPGPHMGDLKVGVDLSKAQANSISRRLLDNVAQIRDLYCHHYDLRLPNVVLRNWPDKPEPVLIDFGHAVVIHPDAPKDSWGMCHDEVVEMRKVLMDPEYGDWHVASPHKQYLYERYAANIGYEAVNNQILNLPEEVRAAQFERIPGTEGADARTRMLQWRVRPGVTRDDYLDRQYMLHMHMYDE